MPPLTGRVVRPLGAMCDECGLADCPFVPSEGPQSAKIALVGEGPGRYEMIYRRPFVGRSGNLLERALQSAGLRREDVFITNAVLCRPPDNRDPETTEVQCCNPRLWRELQAVGPKVIVALGAWAYYALTGKRNLGKVRGMVLRDVNGFTVIPTHHPARVLRQPNLYPELESAIRLAARVAAGALEQDGWPGEVQLREVETVVVRNVEEARQTPFWSGTGQVLAVDVETGSQGQLLSVAVAVDPDKAYVFTREALQDEETRLGLSLVLSNNKVIGHNLKYDAQVLWKNGIACPIDGDTMLLNYVKENRPGVNALKPLANQYFAAGNYDAEAEKYYKRGMEHMPPEQLYEYNAKDAAYTLRLYRILEPEVGQHPVYRNLLLPAYPILAKMEYIGVRIDRERLPKLREELQAQAEYQRAILRYYAGLADFNPNSPKQVAVLLYDVLGLPDVSGERKTDRPTLEQLDHPAVEALLEYRRVTKLIGTYVDAIEARLDENDRLHGHFHLHTTETGRLSSSDPNLQNIPKRQGSLIRDLFIATEGYTMIEADYSNAELRTVTWLADEPAMRKAFVEGLDLHRYTASLVFGVPMEEVTDEQRQIAKTLNFAILYGAEAPKIAQTAGISIPEAEEIIAGWFAAYPKIRDWLHSVHREVRQKGYVETFLGRRRVFPLITRENSAEVLRQAGNFPVQSIASDMTLLSLIRLGQKVDWEDTRLLLTIHDALVLETREDPYLVALAMKRTMEEVPKSVGIDVPFEVEVKMGQRWGSLEEVNFEEVMA